MQTSRRDGDLATATAAKAAATDTSFPAPLRSDDVQGRAVAPGAGTVLNALATGIGSAFALDVETAASVALDPSDSTVAGEVAGDPAADTALIERCVTGTVAAYGHRSPTLSDAGVDLTDDVAPAAVPVGATVRTESDVPMAAGLKSSSAAANATVLATLAALGLAGDVEPVAACRLGVAAARDAGVTVTGAFDDASASMLGGVSLTDNDEDELLAHDPPEALKAGTDATSRPTDEHAATKPTADAPTEPTANRADPPAALVWIPPARAYSADADVERCERIAPVARTAASLAQDGQYAEAMTVNGLSFSAALGFDPEPAVEALPAADAVSLSGTGPSVVAVGDADALATVRARWAERPGELRETTVRAAGATVTDRPSDSDQ